MPPDIISIDAGDDRLRDYEGLTDVSLRRVREPEWGIFIAESPKVIRRAEQTGHVPRSALVLPERLAEVSEALSEHDVPLYVGEPHVLESIAGFHLHRGALASFERPAPRAVSDVVRNAKTVAVCEGIVDHTNVGAIFRSVAGMGADAVIVTANSADPLYRRSIRVSMGSVFFVPWARATSWPALRAELRTAGFHIAALALGEDAVALAEFAPARPERLAIVLGTEGEGLTQEALRHSDVRVTIPMRRGVDSLNVASASAVALYALCGSSPSTMTT